MKRIDYRIQSAKKEDIKSHLVTCSTQFVPELASYVNIEDYAEKISKYAITIEAWSGTDLIGIVAVYYNNEDGMSGFITNVSVEKRYEGLGIAKNLLNICLDIGRMKGFNQVSLKVNQENVKAMRFYEHLGFVNRPEKSLEDIYMFCNLNS